MTTIVKMLPCIDAEDVRFHLMRPEFTQILVTGNPCLVPDLPSLKVQEQIKKCESWTYHNNIKREEEIFKTQSKFLGGCVYRRHADFIELIYLVVNPNLHQKVSVNF